LQHFVLFFMSCWTPYLLAWFQASAAKQMRATLFWVIMQLSSGNFLPTGWDNLSVPPSGVSS
jgi:hypothetical protein